MDQIREQVRRAHRRLSLELFLNRLLRCWFATLVLAVVAIAVPKLWAVEQLPGNWSLRCVVAGLVSGLLIAMVWTWLRGRSELEVAVEIDRRYGLKERIASSLSLSTEEAATPAGQALLTDAMRAVGRIDVNEKFKIRFQRRAWLPLVPALLAFVLAMFVDNREAQSGVDPKTPALTQKQHDNATKKLRERLANLRKKAAAKKGLKNAEGLFRDLEKKTEQMAKAKGVDRKRSLVKINDLAKQLEKRRKQLGGEQQMRKQFAKLNNLNKGPADKMVEAMKKGDFKAAQQELQKLKQQLENGKFDKQAKKELQQQLKQIEEKLAQAKEARQQAMENLKKQIEQAKKQGDLAKAGEMQQKLDQMQQQQNQMNKLNQLAQKMGECQQCMKAGDGKGAAAALDQMMKQMEQLQQEMDEGEMLDIAMDQLQMAKDAMGCKACQGGGCKACQGGGQGNQLSDQFSEKGGNGMGAGRGSGPRPDEKNSVKFRNSRVRQKPGKGAAVVVGEAGGPNFRGQVVESIKKQMVTESSKPADPLVLERLPKRYREHAEEYNRTFQE